GLAGARQLGLRGLGEREIALEVAVAGVLELAALAQPVERVLADRLEHAEARLAVRALALPDEAVVHELGDAVEHLAELEPQRLSCDGFCRIERAAADEDAEPREHGLARL